MKLFSSIRLRTMLSLLCLTLAAIMLLSTFTLVSVTRKQFAQNTATKEKDFHTTVSMLDDTLYEFVNMANQFSTVSDLRPIQFLGNSPMAQIEARQFLQSIKSLNQQIVDICLYLSNYRNFIATQASFSYESFARSYNSFTYLTREELRSLFADANVSGVSGLAEPTFVSVGDMYTSDTMNRVANVLLVLLPLPRWSNSAYAMLGVFVDTREIRQSLEMVADGGYSVLVDDHGEQLFSVGDPVWAKAETVQHFSVSMKRLGLHCELFVPNKALSGLGFTSSWLYSILLPLILVILISALLMTRWANAPLDRLMTGIGYDRAQAVSESDYIQQYISRLREDVSRHIRYTDELIIRKLLAGEKLTTAELTRCDDLIKKDYAHCQTAVIHLRTDMEQMQSLKSIVYEHAVLTALPYTQSNIIVCIISADKGETALMSLTEYLLNSLCDQATNVVAMGPVQDNTLQLRLSLTKARELLDDMLRTGRTGIENTATAKRSVENENAGVLETLENHSNSQAMQEEIAAAIELRLEEPDFGLSLLAEHYGLSDSAFSHMFKRTFGTNFLTYVNQKKTLRAKELLKDSTISLEAIAIRLGYSSASNFSRMFKSYEGVPPSIYRQMLQNSAPERNLDEV